MPDPPKAFPAPLGDRYELTELLGRGAMGSVYRARDKRLERDVALKVVNEEQAPQRLERFRREGEITASLDHPGIVRLHTAGTVDDCPYLAYELLEGCQTLGEALPGKTLAERVALIRDAATALGYAHERGVIHRDVKNENLLVDENGRLHVADFGLATAQGLERLTRTGALVGTPTHMSPEMIRGKQGIGPQTDVWGLGVVLYQALTGELPFQAATFTELTARILNGTYQDPRSFGGEVPGALIAVCARALAVDPERRYPSGAALAADLEAWLDGRSVSAHTSGLQRLAAVLILVAGVVAVAFALDRAPAKPALVSDPPVEVPALPLPTRATQPTPTIEPGTRLAVLRHGQRGRTYGRFLSETEALTWGEDGTLRRWDLKRRVEIGRHTPDVGPLTSLGLVGEGVVLAGSRGVIWIPKLSQREPPRTLLGPPGAYAILPLPNRDSVIVARANKELVEVDLRTASVRRQLRPNRHPVYVLGRSTDHARILTSSGNPTARVGLGDQVVRVIDVESGERVSRAHFQTRASAVAFLPGQRGYLVGTGIGRLAEFDALGAVKGEFVSPAVSSKQVMKRLAHDGTVLDLVFTPDGARVFSLSCGAVVDRSLDAPTRAPQVHTEVRLWRLADRTEIGAGLRFERRAYSLALSPSSTRLLIGSQGCVELWSAP